jgi:DNA-binding LytR/AlgR family response regulator
MSPYFFLRQGSRNTRIDFRNILYIEASRNYSRLVSTDNTALAIVPLKDWLAFLPAEDFCQIHRAIIVVATCTRQISGQSVNSPASVQPIHILRSPLGASTP